MKKSKFKVPLYHYDVTVIQIESSKDKDALIKEFKKMRVPEENYKDSIEYVENNYMNGGDTYRNMLNKRFLVIIYLCESENIRREVMGHEKRHVEDRILEHVGINDIEASAYLAGYLSQYMY
jgi:hypothetical protein